MASGIVVDANVMNLFTQALIANEFSAARTLINSIRGTHGFAIDARGQIEQQWRDTCRNQLFGEWLFQGLKDGVIRMVDAKLDKQHKKSLHIRLGFPGERYEPTYVGVAANAPPGYIVTEDIDFWEPRVKRADEKTKTTIKQSRQGGVYKYLTKELGIQVGTVLQATSDLGYQ